MRIKLEDLELALLHIKKYLTSNSRSRWLHLRIAEEEESMSISYTSQKKHQERVVIYDAIKSITPETVSVAKLYKGDK